MLAFLSAPSTYGSNLYSVCLCTVNLQQMKGHWRFPLYTITTTVFAVSPLHDNSVDCYGKVQKLFDDPTSKKIGAGKHQNIIISHGPKYSEVDSITANHTFKGEELRMSGACAQNMLMGPGPVRS